MSEEAFFEIGAPGGLSLAVVREGEGSPVVLAHGITAHRDLVVHGSRALARAGHEVTRYDARAHGDSEPAPDGVYGYEVLADDLAAVVADSPNDARPVLAGHSMGAHTIVNLALRDPGKIAGLVIIGPAQHRHPAVGGVPAALERARRRA